MSFLLTVSFRSAQLGVTVADSIVKGAQALRGSISQQ